MLGRTIGRYRIVGKLGEGGMGVVWKAEHELSGRIVAIKFLSDDSADSVPARRRFFREAQLMSALHHPGVATLYESGEADGRLYLAVEFIDGETVTGIAAGGPIPMSEVLRIGIDVADALAYSHELGLVHRDVSGRNIMVAKGGRVVLIDFGVALLRVGSQNTTTSGTIVGTVAYVAPEVLEGRSAEPRSDLYSLGVVLYELAAGIHPFPSERDGALLFQAVNRTPDPPSRYRPEAGEEFDRVVLRAMARDRDRRHASAAELSEDLRRIRTLLTARASAGRPSVPERTGPSSGAIGDAPGSVLRDDSDPRLTPVLALLRRTYDEPSVDAAITAIEELVASNPDCAPAHAALATACLHKSRMTRDAGWLERAERACAVALWAEPSLLPARIAEVRLKLRSGHHQYALTALACILEAHPNEFEALVLSSLAHEEMGHFDEAERFARKAIASDPDRWLGHERLGMVEFRRGHFVDAAEHWRQVVRLAPDNESAHHNLGAALFQLGRLREAATAYRRALDIKPSALAYTGLGTVQFYLRRHAEAIAMFEKATALTPRDPRVWRNLGDSERWVPGRREYSSRSFDRAIDLLRAQLDQDAENADCWSNLAKCLAKRGRIKESLAAIHRALEIAPANVIGLARAITVYELAGARERAIEFLKAAVAAGYGRVELERDPELHELRHEPEVHRILKDGDDHGPRKAV
jgi:serine/threonine-protein kinase